MIFSYKQILIDLIENFLYKEFIIIIIVYTLQNYILAIYIITNITTIALLYKIADMDI